MHLFFVGHAVAGAACEKRRVPEDSKGLNGNPVLMETYALATARKIVGAGVHRLRALESHPEDFAVVLVSYQDPRRVAWWGIV